MQMPFRLILQSLLQSLRQSKQQQQWNDPDHEGGKLERVMPSDAVVVVAAFAVVDTVFEPVTPLTQPTAKAITPATGRLAPTTPINTAPVRA
mmetsp:Transcript_41188/g.46014  ORF Transcript_41188/g.46014 Transcript_41188/m.46014 type:complete len:92 (-) Transcript_41188:10-285(-)